MSTEPRRVALTLLTAAVIGAAAVLALQRGAIPLPHIDGYHAIWRENRTRMAPGVIVFVLFSLYWSIAAKNKAMTEVAEPVGSTILHQLLVTASFLLIVFPVPGLLTRILPNSSTLIPGGAGVVTGGALFAIWARRHLGVNWSREVRIAVGHKLVRTGPYARVRHPIYTGALCIYIGLAIEAGRVSAPIGLGLVLLTYWRKIVLEERILQQSFGVEFEEYRRRSGALIPPLP